MLLRELLLDSVLWVPKRGKKVLFCAPVIEPREE